MDGKMMDSRGLTLVELAVVLIILMLLGTFLVRNLANFNKGNSIEDDCRKIHAFLQKMRLEAFTNKQTLNVVLSSNGTSLCEVVTETCIELKNRFVASGNFTITKRGIFNSGNIHVASNTPPGNPTYSCVAISSTRARLGEWNGTCTPK